MGPRPGLTAAADAELVRQALTRRWSVSGAAAKARRDAYGCLVLRHEGSLRRFLFYLTRDHALTDDLAQDAFVAGWEKLGTLKVPEKFAPWLRSLAYRLFLRHRRRLDVETRAAESLSVTAETLAQDTDPGAPDELEKLLAVCSPVERECVVLCYGFGFTVTEVAEAQARPPSTIKSHLHRARKKMQAVDPVEGPREVSRCDI